MSIKDELERIRRRTDDGKLYPQDVVEFARDETTELHKHFEWNDSDAAHQYRLSQARRIIRVSVKYVERTETATHVVPVYVSLPDSRGDSGGYETMARVLSSDERRAELIRLGAAEVMQLAESDRFRALGEWDDVRTELIRLAIILTARADMLSPSKTEEDGEDDEPLTRRRGEEGDGLGFGV